MLALKSDQAAVDREWLDRCICGREQPLFAGDLERNWSRIRDQVVNRRILVVGGGGTIGAATIQLLINLSPSALNVIDHSENYLAELVRDIRGQSDAASSIDLRLWPIDFGGPVTNRLLREQPPYDVVLNFAALKHVRSEKDVYSLLQMIDTNIVRQARFMRWIAARGGCVRYFSVSTDKATNPVSLMGATKRVMERLLFGIPVGEATVVTSARFANVAFSNGSLLQSWLRRLELGQPLAVPRNTRRYFLTQREAGEICLLAALLAGNGEILVPRLDPATELRLLDRLAVEVLALHGFAAEPFTDESEAKRDLARLRAERRWPLLLTPQDTSGEKPYEEFIGEGERAVEIGLEGALAVALADELPFDPELIEQLSRLVESADAATSKAQIVATLATAIPNFRHIETGKSLDGRL